MAFWARFDHAARGRPFGRSRGRGSPRCGCRRLPAASAGAVVDFRHGLADIYRLGRGRPDDSRSETAQNGRDAGQIQHDSGRRWFGRIQILAGTASVDALGGGGPLGGASRVRGHDHGQLHQHVVAPDSRQRSVHVDRGHGERAKCQRRLDRLRSRHSSEQRDRTADQPDVHDSGREYQRGKCCGDGFAVCHATVDD